MKKLLLILLLCPLFVTSCRAEGLMEQAAAQTGAAQVEQALPEAERQISGPLRLDGGYDTDGALKRLWTRLADKARESFNESLRHAVSLLGLSAVSALAGSLCRDKNVGAFAEQCSCCAAALLLAGSVESVIGQASQALSLLSDYSHAALPAIYTAAAVSGAAVSAPARYAAASLVMDLMISAQLHLILPLVFAYLAAAVSKSLFDNGILRALCRLLKWSVTKGLTGITLGFSAYLSLTTLVTGSVDAVAVKTARTVLSTVLPVVGGILSDSASTLLSAAALIKNSVGAFSLMAVLALCAGPFAVLSVKLLLFKSTAAATELLAGARLSQLVGELGTCFGMLLGMVGSCGIMLFLSIMAGIKVVSA